MTSPRDRAQRWSARGRLAAQATVLGLVVGGTTAFAGLHKTVLLDVDGDVESVSAFGRTVGDVLASHGLEVGPHDVVVPAVDAAVSDGGEVLVLRAREVVVEVDGEPTTLWTTAATVGEVVAELGLRGDARTAVSRSAAIGREPVRVSTTRTVHVSVDGETTALATDAPTVRGALREAGVVLGPHDQLSVPLGSATVEGLVVLVTRVVTEVRSETTTQPFETLREDDPDLLVGREVVATPGREGVRTVSYEARLVDGVEIDRTTIAETTVSEPVTEVVRVGTKPEPVEPPAPSAPSVPSAPPVDPGTSRAIGLDMVLARGWGQDQFSCLDALWTKESNWRVNAANPSSGAYGIPQSLPGSKMATAGADWRTNPVTQITWGLSYIAGRYGTPCDAWAHSQARNWY